MYIAVRITRDVSERLYVWYTDNGCMYHDAAAKRAQAKAMAADGFPWPGSGKGNGAGVKWKGQVSRDPVPNHRLISLLSRDFSEILVENDEFCI